MDERALRAWLHLRAKLRLGEAALVGLVRALGGPEAVLTASAAELGEVEGAGPALAAALRAPLDPETRERVEQEVRAATRANVGIVTCLDAAYPRRLRMIADPPLLLYLTGTLEPRDDDAVAVVGTRRPTPAGRNLSEQLAGALAAAGFTVVSGLARGVDAAAHRGALASGGRTIGVLGCGIDRTYPSEHATLRRQIEARGAVLSELPWGAPPLAAHFPRRNRLISGLSLGVLVTEAAARSGSLITARLAAEQGRDVFAIPGSVLAEQSRGPHSLIKQGAKLVESVEDVIEEVLPQLEAPERITVRRRAAPAPPPMKTEETVLYNLLSHEPTPIDELIVRSGLSPGLVNSLLLAMELKGLARRLPGHCSVRV